MTSPGRAWASVPDALEDVSALGGVAVDVGDDGDERGFFAAPVGAGGGDGAAYALDVGEGVGRGVGVAGADECVERGERARADARVLEVVETGACGAGLCE